MISWRTKKSHSSGCRKGELLNLAVIRLLRHRGINQKLQLKSNQPFTQISEHAYKLKTYKSIQTKPLVSLVSHFP